MLLSECSDMCRKRSSEPKMRGITVGPDGTRYIRFSVAVWYQPSDKTIHITAPSADKRFHTTVSGNPKSVRYHRSLYRHLQRMLRNCKRWPVNASRSEE